jgi:hypothetical protein
MRTMMISTMVMLVTTVLDISNEEHADRYNSTYVAKNLTIARTIIVIGFIIAIVQFLIIHISFPQQNQLLDMFGFGQPQGVAEEVRSGRRVAGGRYGAGLCHGVA